MAIHTIHGVASIRRSDYFSMACIQGFALYHAQYFPYSQMVLVLMADPKNREPHLEYRLLTWLSQNVPGARVEVDDSQATFDTFYYQKLRHEFASHHAGNHWISFLDIDERLPRFNVSYLASAAVQRGWDGYSGYLVDRISAAVLVSPLAEPDVFLLPNWDIVAPEGNDYNIPSWVPGEDKPVGDILRQESQLFPNRVFITTAIGSTALKVPLARADCLLSVGQHRPEDSTKKLYFMPTMTVNHYKWHAGVVPQTNNRIIKAPLDKRIGWVDEFCILQNMFRKVQGQHGIAGKSVYLKMPSY